MSTDEPKSDGKLIEGIEALGEQLQTLAPCPYSRSIFIGWIMNELRELQAEGIRGPALRKQLEIDYLEWVKRV